MTSSPPALSLNGLDGQGFALPSGRQTLVCFVKEDCKTCNLVAPLVEALHRRLGDLADIRLISQDSDGGLAFRERHDLSVPVLSDAGCRTSMAWGFEIVPAAFLLDESGAILNRFEGFVKEEWRVMDAQLQPKGAGQTPDIDWTSYPDWRPGCGSKHLDPDMNDRLQAEAEGSPLRARKINIGQSDDISEFMFDQGFSDGLPLVPPTPERVLRMLRGAGRDSQEIIAIVPPNMAPATVEKIAINAVMAGCRPDYLPVVIAALEAVCTDAFNMHGVTATTMGASPVLVVNGPVRHRLGMNMQLSALGPDNRANATIGRALRLIIRNVGGARPGGVDRSTLGSPMKITMCFAEWEERSPWAPLHVERGYRPDESVVTAFAMTSGPVQIVDQESRAPDQIAGSLGLGLEGVFLPKMRRMHTDALLVVCPEHVATLTSQGDYSKERLRARIQEVTRRPLREMLADDRSGAGLSAAAAARLSPAQLDETVSKFAGPSNIHLCVAGSTAGKFSAAFHGWVTGAMGSTAVSRRIETL